MGARGRASLLGERLMSKRRDQMSAFHHQIAIGLQRELVLLDGLTAVQAEGIAKSVATSIEQDYDSTRRLLAAIARQSGGEITVRAEAFAAAERLDPALSRLDDGSWIVKETPKAKHG
jgi:hypothetical protein